MKRDITLNMINLTQKMGLIVNMYHDQIVTFDKRKVLQFMNVEQGEQTIN